LQLANADEPNHTAKTHSQPASHTAKADPNHPQESWQLANADELKSKACAAELKSQAKSSQAKLNYSQLVYI